MILIDYIGHLVSTDSEEELHIFAKKLGLRRRWFQNERKSHYDVTTSFMRLKAVRLGAEIVEPRQIMSRAWWAI